MTFEPEISEHHIEKKDWLTKAAAYSARSSCELKKKNTKVKWLWCLWWLWEFRTWFISSFIESLVSVHSFSVNLTPSLHSFFFLQVYGRHSIRSILSVSEPFHASAPGLDLFVRPVCDFADVLWCCFDVLTGNMLLFPPPLHTEQSAVFDVFSKMTNLCCHIYLKVFLMTVEEPPAACLYDSLSFIFMLRSWTC